MYWLVWVDVIWEIDLDFFKDCLYDMEDVLSCVIFFGE